MASQMPSALKGMSAPQSIEKITRRAQDYEFKPQIPLRYWLRTAATLIKEAQIYEREGNDEQAYFLLFRHAQLVLDKLATHPEARDAKNRRALAEAEKEVHASLAKLEVLKPRIKKRYERYQQLVRERQAERGAGEWIEEGHDSSPAAQALAATTESLEAGANRDLAVRLAHSEINRRATARKANRHVSISPEEEDMRGSSTTRIDWGHAVDGDHFMDSNDLSHRMRDIRLQMDQTQHGERHSEHAALQSYEPRPEPVSSPSTYRYPTVPRQRSLDDKDQFPTIRTLDHTPTRREPPSLPPKARILPDTSVRLDQQPPRASKESPLPAVPAKVHWAETNSKPASSDLNPSSYIFKPSAFLENGTPLRTVFLPPDLRSRFLQLAAPNTRRNLETCGILCGTLVSNALFVSKLLIPEQISTSDTCETVNESAIFDYCDAEDLMVLGWIHTHPTQTCFMSSRDLHTHCGYQVMLPESIAIVCAPSKDPDWGVFRLTDPPGLKTILNCTNSGLFHPHSVPNTYTDALRPGHVLEAKGLKFETVDLRP